MDEILNKIKIKMKNSMFIKSILFAILFITNLGYIFRWKKNPIVSLIFLFLYYFGIKIKQLPSINYVQECGKKVKTLKAQLTT